MALSTWTPWCLADRGTVQKVIVLPRDDMETEELMLEEIEVFKVRAGLSSILCCVTSTYPASLLGHQLAHWDTSHPLVGSGGTPSAGPPACCPLTSPPACLCLHQLPAAGLRCPPWDCSVQPSGHPSVSFAPAPV